MHGVRPADRGRRGLRKAEVADLALADQVGHRPDRLLDRHIRVHAVLIVEIDVIDAESLERGVTRRSHVLRTPIHAARLGDRKSTRLNSSHSQISYAVFCLKKKNKILRRSRHDTGLNSRCTGHYTHESKVISVTFR